ncbi:MAG TPA: IclR family transcriptional regulator C-terminal domain-containing protein [Actinomycetota bacterium]|nr:IclR family transcriptional regulator C-terminal domain-containing protein [Actinomycetota bacterium]
MATLNPQAGGDAGGQDVRPVRARRPLHCTALGKAYLAALPGQELEARLTGVELTRFTASTITDPVARARLREQVRPSADARPAARPPGSTAPTWSGSG